MKSGTVDAPEPSEAPFSEAHAGFFYHCYYVDHPFVPRSESELS